MASAPLKIINNMICSLTYEKGKLTENQHPPCRTGLHVWRSSCDDQLAALHCAFRSSLCGRKGIVLSPGVLCIR